MKKSELVKLIREASNEIVNESYYDRIFNRMDGLINIEYLKTFKNIVSTIYLNLLEEGFEKEEIQVYLKHVMEQI